MPVGNPESTRRSVLLWCWCLESHWKVFTKGAKENWGDLQKMYVHKSSILKLLSREAVFIESCLLPKWNFMEVKVFFVCVCGWVGVLYPPPPFPPSSLTFLPTFSSLWRGVHFLDFFCCCCCFCLFAYRTWLPSFHVSLASCQVPWSGEGRLCRFSLKPAGMIIKQTSPSSCLKKNKTTSAAGDGGKQAPTLLLEWKTSLFSTLAQ